MMDEVGTNMCTWCARLASMGALLKQEGFNMCGFGSTDLHKKMRAMCFREMVGQCLVWERRQQRQSKSFLDGR